MGSELSVGAISSLLYPLRRCKIIHFVRHAQGIHNLEESSHLKQSPELLDARLSPFGWEQVDNLKKHVHETDLFNRIKLVVVSPLSRTLQTAAGVFGSGAEVVESAAADETPLMTVADPETNRGPISSRDCPPFLAVELCREKFGRNTCDKRRSVTEYKNLYPAVDFSLIETDNDSWWTPEVRESNESVRDRGLQFINWLWTRQEDEIAVVTHSEFLLHMLSEFGKDCGLTVKAELQTFFRNCELRSIVLVDRGRKEEAHPASLKIV